MSTNAKAYELPNWRAMHADTDAWAESIQFDFYRSAPAWRKLELAGDLTKGMLLLAESGLISRYPQASSKEIKRRLADLLLGADLAMRVYGPILSYLNEATDSACT